MRKMVILALALCPLKSADALAGGFQIGEMATRASGMASAFTAVADDASAAWYNPAGVAFMHGGQIMLGSDLIIVPGASFTSNAGNPSHPAATSSSDKVAGIPHTYVSYHDPVSRFGFSLGLNAPFGLETDWPADAGNPFNGKNTFSRINMVAVNPNVSYRIGDHLAIAAGVDYFNLYRVDLNNTAQLLQADGDGWGGNAAALYRHGTLSFGVNYRSRVKADLSGTATSQGALAATFSAGSSAGTTSITLPDQVNIGLAYRPGKQWLLSLDVDWVNWKTYEQTVIHYDSASYLAALNSFRAALGGAAVTQTTIPNNWKATVALRAGAEWAYAPNMRVRAGYIFDPSPINDVDFSPSIPGNDRHLFTFGYSYAFSNSSILDFAYAFVYIMARNQTASQVGDLSGAPNTVKNGLYESSAHIVALSWRYHF